MARHFEFGTHTPKEISGNLCVCVFGLLEEGQISLARMELVKQVRILKLTKQELQEDCQK